MEMLTARRRIVAEGDSTKTTPESLLGCHCGSRRPGQGSAGACASRLPARARRCRPEAPQRAGPHAGAAIPCGDAPSTLDLKRRERGAEPQLRQSPSTRERARPHDLRTDPARGSRGGRGTNLIRRLIRSAAGLLLGSSESERKFRGADACWLGASSPPIRIRCVSFRRFNSRERPPMLPQDDEHDLTATPQNEQEPAQGAQMRSSFAGDPLATPCCCVPPPALACRHAAMSHSHEDHGVVAAQLDVLLDVAARMTAQYGAPTNNRQR